MNSYKTAAEAAQDKEQLTELQEMLDVSPAALRRDENGLWILKGSRGHASTWGDGKSWHLIVYEVSTALRWTYHKKRLSFVELTQNGDSEGTFRAFGPVNQDQAGIVREILGLPKRVKLSEERRTFLRQWAAQHIGQKG